MLRWIGIFIGIWLASCPVALAFEDSSSLDKLIEELIYEKLRDDKLELELKYDSPNQLRKIQANRGNIENVSLLTIDQALAKFRVRVDYNSLGSDEISGHYILYAEVPVASRLIKIGEVIVSSDIYTNRVRASSVRSYYASSSSEVIGMQARKNLLPGSMIRVADIARQPVIKQHDPVNLVYLSGNIELKTTGIAMGAGGIGDMIKVRNEDTGAVLLGQIINKNTVQVGGSNE